MERLKVALLCGGPSRERGISLNSARSIVDHLQAPDIMLVPIYFDLDRQAYELASAHLYSNTPSDYDFKVSQIGIPLDSDALARRLREVDIVFPAIHGAFGEDGGIQSYLESIDVPYVGSSASACRLAFDKHDAGRFLDAHGYYAQPTLLLVEPGNKELPSIQAFFESHRLQRAVVKPARAGSSVGVYVADSAPEALEAAVTIYGARIDRRIIVEPFCYGSEFTLIVLQNEKGQPVALLPTEIGLETPGEQIFDYRKKYLPTSQVTYYVPPRFDATTVETIQRQAEQLFDLLALQDCARFDGWVLPSGEIWFSDFNLVSGMD